MNNQPKLALIVAQPGPLRNSLFSLLATMPQLNLVAESKDLASLAHMAAQIQPNIVLIEAGFGQERLAESVLTIKATWAVSPTIVLVDDPRQKWEAEQAGADVVLFKGVRAAKLIELVEILLQKEPSFNRTPSPSKITLAN